MYKVTRYRNAESSSVLGLSEIEEVFKIIKDGDSAIKHIEHARTFEKGSKDYDEVRKLLIPTFRFNFLFNDRVSNKNIIAPTGLIYIDVDQVDEIPASDFIFAKWKSLSLTGYCVLVKVDNLSINNFSDSYIKISTLLNIYSDKCARKATQQTIQSYDPDIYINYNSKTFNCLEIEKVSSPIKLKKRKECLTTNETFFNVENQIKVRYNNINDYFKNNDSAYIVFNEEKESLCIPFIPLKVKKGRRNSVLFIYLSQIVALNLQISKAYIKVLANSVNDNAMSPKLPDNELNRLINSIFKLKESNDLKMFYNKKRRILFNPNNKISFKDKMKIVNKVLSGMAKERTTEKIYECIEEWDFESNGKITQKKIASLLQLSISTVKRYWCNFKSFVNYLNNDFKINYR
ncbi:hypothetical protein [Polaribacter sp. IC063]|uniref:hypothetical protein n=1 Tax=Polaribacter sp. IC063 TaxID=57031 RepID=UPI0011BF1321|nr:hypothetical protein [Polaribacter sp. IC063]TXD53653.1 hypothetical protein ES043_03245 [Polaribacter sp. IC063]